MPGEGDVRPVDLAGHQVHGGRPDEGGHEQIDRPVVELLRRRALLQDPVTQHGDPLAERHGLHLVMGHVDRGHAEAFVEPGQLGPHGHAQLGVEVGQRLVHEERRRLAHHRPAHGDPLALPAGECRRLALHELLEAQDARRLLHPAIALRGGNPAHPQREAEVAPDRHVRVERVVLEDHGDVPVALEHVRHVLAAEADRARAHLLEAGNQAQQGGLATAGGTHQHHELAVGDVEAHRVHRTHIAVEQLRDLLELDARHQLPGCSRILAVPSGASASREKAARPSSRGMISSQSVASRSSARRASASANSARV